MEAASSWVDSYLGEWPSQVLEKVIHESIDQKDPTTWNAFNHFSWNFQDTNAILADYMTLIDTQNKHIDGFGLRILRNRVTEPSIRKFNP